jgi:hypothetical protein
MTDGVNSFATVGVVADTESVSVLVQRPVVVLHPGSELTLVTPIGGWMLARLETEV